MNTAYASVAYEKIYDFVKGRLEGISLERLQHTREQGLTTMTDKEQLIEAIKEERKLKSMLTDKDLGYVLGLNAALDIIEEILP